MTLCSCLKAEEVWAALWLKDQLLKPWTKLVSNANVSLNRVLTVSLVARVQPHQHRLSVFVLNCTLTLLEGTQVWFFMLPVLQKNVRYFWDNWERTYCVQAGLMAGEGEGETQRQSSTFHSHVVQEVGDAVHNVVKELERDMLLVVCILEAIVRFSITLFSMERQKVLDAFCKFCLLWPFDVKQKCAKNVLFPYFWHIFTFRSTINNI